MDNFQEFKNALTNIEMGWTNQWSFMAQLEKLLEQKPIVLKNRKALEREGYDVIDIYKQVDEFQKCIGEQKTLTDNEEERIILAALEYAKNNRPIIISKFNKSIAKLNELIGDSKSSIESSLRYRYDVSANLVNFYLYYQDELDLFDVIIKFLTFTKYLHELYPNKKECYYSTPYVIEYLKFLIKKKEFDKAKYILKNFDLPPIGKGDTDKLEKIKTKLALK